MGSGLNAIWLWQEDNDAWSKYDKGTSLALELAYSQGSSEGRVDDERYNKKWFTFVSFVSLFGLFGVWYRLLGLFVACILFVKLLTISVTDTSILRTCCSGGSITKTKRDM